MIAGPHGGDHGELAVSSMKYIPGVDGLRSIAVMSVLLFHAGFSSLAGGFVGVDVFFVISGFLITQLIYKEVSNTGTFDYHRFYSRRVRRLFPALFVTVLVSFICANLFFSPEHLSRFSGEVIYSLFSLSNFYFWSESGYFNTASDFKPLLHTWSLSVEEQFYIFWPILVVFFGKRFGSKGVVSFLLISGIASLLGNVSFIDGSSVLVSWAGTVVSGWFSDGASTIFYLTPFRVFEFCLGAIIVFLPKVNSSSVHNFLFASGVALIGYSVFEFNALTPFPTYNALIPCVGSALVIYSSGSYFSKLTISTSPFVFLGKISYSIYLVHWPIIVFYKYYYSGDVSLSAKVAIVLVSVALGYLLFRFVETPFRSQSGKTISSNGFNLSCLMLACLLVVPSATAWGNSGWKWRVSEPPKGISAQLADSKQFHIDQYGGNGYQERGWISGGGVADVVVIGDSHARQYAYGLDHVLGKPEKLNIYLSSVSCILLPGMTRLTPGTDWDSLCSAALDDALAVLDRNPKAVLVIAQLWVDQLTIAATNPGHVPVPDNKGSGGYRLLVEKIRELKSRIGSRKMIVIGNVPGAGSPDIAGCYNRPSFARGYCLSKIGIPYSDVRSVAINKALADVSKIPGVLFINPHDVFCHDGFCKSIAHDSILYSDSNHLSKAGSEYFVSKEKDNILTHIKRPPELSLSKDS